ncbi:MAG: flavin reductase family protein [Eggerthellaceae bacterium]|jgi:flavin reductase (DIM6/NTAB) family NADH-FMN oxidoreductase RutF
MKKELKVQPALFPMPVLMIATYDENGTVDVMNMAWGGICASDMVSLNIGERHKTSANIKKNGAFTLSIADAGHMAEADYFGIASANNDDDKFARSGMTATKSKKVNAPVVNEFPVTLECEVVECRNEVYGFHVLGKIVGVLAEESVLDEDGTVNPKKLNALLFDNFQNGYYTTGDKVGQAWNAGKALMP